MKNQLSRIETQVMDAFQLEGIKNQLASLLSGDKSKTEAFKTRILKMSLNYGMDRCSPESIINCGIQALTLNMPLEAGQGYIVNYGGKAAFDCGYKGWQVLAKRAGYSVLADVVYSCDEFRQDGFGFDREMVFNPNLTARQGANDSWAKENLTGVIVSVMEDETGNKTHAFVERELIFKIIGKSPSAGKTDKNGKHHSPHDNWAEQMFCAKAIKQVLSKFPIDLSEASQLQQAIDIVNETESNAQQEMQGLPEYPEERFTENFPKWKVLVESGKKQAMAIITQLSNSYTLTSEQLTEVMTLTTFEPIEGEAINVDG